MANEKRTATTKLPTRSMWNRSIWVLVVMALTVFCIMGRLLYVQVFQHDYWSSLAVSQQMSDTLVDASRGTIYDCNLNVLAESEQVWTVIMDPSNIPDEDTAEIECEMTHEEMKELIAELDKYCAKFPDRK